LDWQLGGFAADPLSGSMGDSSQAAQLAQAMAGFGGGDGLDNGSNAAPLRRHIAAAVLDDAAAGVTTAEGLKIYDYMLTTLLTTYRAYARRCPASLIEGRLRRRS